MYQVELSPITPTGGYSDPVDITRFVEQRGLKRISQSVDSSDFSLNRNINSIRMTLINYNRFFSVYSRESLFLGSRDESIVTISFIDKETGKKTVSFDGVIDESGTYENEKNKTIMFIITSFESVFKKHNIPLFEQGLSFSGAFSSIFRLPEIAKRLSVRSINVGIDIVIDDKRWLESQNIFRAVNLLLIASNSIMQINTDRSISIIPRTGEERPSKKTFHGFYNKKRETPIILELNAINTGFQRVFNFIKINNREIRNNASEQLYGFKETEEIEIPFINDEAKEQEIGEAILSGFLFQKEELEIKVLAKDVQDIQLNDVVSVNFLSKVSKLEEQDFIPLYGLKKNVVIPKEAGKTIPRALNWEIYEKNESPKDLNCVLKLRQL